MDTLLSKVHGMRFLLYVIKVNTWLFLDSAARVFILCVKSSEVQQK